MKEKTRLPWMNYFPGDTLGNVSPPMLHVEIILIKRPFKGKNFFSLIPSGDKSRDFIVPPLMHAYICHSIYLSATAKVEQALEKRGKFTHERKKCPLIVSVDANNKEKGSRWRLTGNYHQVAEQIILTLYPEIIPCHGSGHKLLPRHSRRFLRLLIYDTDATKLFPTTINQTFKSTDKEKERQWDKITRIPWEKRWNSAFFIVEA